MKKSSKSTGHHDQAEPEHFDLSGKHLPFILGATGTGLDIIDVRFNLRYVDPAWAKKYGDYRGRKCYEYFMGRGAPCPDCALPEVLRTKKMRVSEKILVREGNRQILVTSYPFQDENGEWLVAEVNVDVTGRICSETALRESESRLRSTLLSIGDAVICTDAAGMITDINAVAEKLTGWSAAEARGRSVEEVFHVVNEDTRAPVANSVGRALREGLITGFSNHLLLMARDGAEYPVYENAAPIRAGAGGIIGVVLVFREQSAERAVEKTILRRMEMESFVADFSARCINVEADKIDAAVNDLLCGIGKLTGVDGADVFMVDEHANTVSNTHAWNTPCVPAQRAPLMNLPCADIPWWMDKLRRGETIEIVRMDDLPPEAAMERKILDDFKIRSTLFVPIARGSMLYGFMGLSVAQSERVWSVEDRRVVETLANIMALVFERRQVERTLLERENRYRALFEGSMDAVMLFAEDKFVDCNAATLKIFGCPSKADFIGRHPGELSPLRQADGTDSMSAANERVATALAKGGNHFEWVHRRLNGGDFYADVKLSAVVVRGCKMVQAVVRDITAQKEAETRLLADQQELMDMNARLQQNQAQLVQSEKMASIGQLAAGVAHEINNPMGFISSNLNTLADYIKTFKELAGAALTLAGAPGAPPDAAAREDAARRITELRKREDIDYVLQDVDNLVAESADGARRVQEIVQSLKSFSRLDEAVVKEADLNECLETTLKVVWNELKYKCEIVREFGDLPHVRCYPGQLNQVFMNLLVNAAQAIPEKGVITIHTEADEREIRVSVADTGKGIPPEHIPKLFEPFFTTKPVGKGTGLGLSVSYNIAQKHKGRIEVASEFGKGTVFTIHLPLEGVPDS